MATVLLVVERILGLLLSLFGLVGAVQQSVQHAAQEHAPYQLEGIVTTTSLNVANPTYGLSALEQRLEDLTSAYTVVLQDILDAIAAITPTPPAPPPTADENATAVWSAADPNSPGGSKPYGDEQWQPYAMALQRNIYELKSVWEAPWFLAFVNPDDPVAMANLASYPEPDFTDIQADDTILSWLQRTADYFTWDQPTDVGCPHGYRPAHMPHEVHWYCHLTPDQFASFARRAAAPPVWPGLDRVTLGAPVALAPDVTVPGPLDGVLIAITTPPSGLGKFEVGGETWWYRAGQVSFVSDNGDVEAWQYITWTHALYCPRQMFRADHAIVRGLAGIGGTVTPWLTT